MAKNKISGSIIEQCDCSVISFLDTSEYLIPDNIENPVLRIYPPNWDKYISIPYNPQAITLIRPDHIKHSSFPGGVYHFVQSICPNEKTQVSFCWLNICCELSKIYNLACELDLCDNEEDLGKLYDLIMMFQIAAGLVKECDTEKGVKLYNEAVKQLNKLAADSDCKFC